jgi:hypothetical protein
MARKTFARDLKETRLDIEGGSIVIFEEVVDLYPDDVVTTAAGSVKAGRRVSDCIGYALNALGNFDSFLVKLAKPTPGVRNAADSTTK